MGSLNTQVFARRKFEPNTFIGGIAKIGGTGVNAPINSRTVLASKLGINASRISGFRVIGDDVQCRIKGSYGFSGGGASVFPNTLTYFIDNDQLVKTLGNGSFVNMVNLEIFQAYGITGFGMGGATKFTNTKVEELYFPNLNASLANIFGNNDFVNNSLLKRFIAPTATFQNVGGNWLANSPKMELIDLRKMKQIGRTTPSRGDVFNGVGSSLIPGVAKFHENIVSVAADGGNPDVNMMKLYNKGWQIQLYNDTGIYVSDFTI